MTTLGAVTARADGVSDIVGDGVAPGAEGVEDEDGVLVGDARFDDESDG
jgi:hypothetical protein